MKKLFIPPVFVLISLLLIVGFYFLFPSFNWLRFPINLSGILIVFVGFSLMGRSRDAFKKSNVALSFGKSRTLISEGIFARTRNPMYLGMFLLLAGVAICCMNLISQMVPLAFLLLARIIFIPREEKMLLEEFGEEYQRYKNKVRRWF